MLGPKIKWTKLKTKRSTALNAQIIPREDSMNNIKTLALFDSGCSVSITSSKLIPKHFWTKLERPVLFNTKIGTFAIKHKADIELKIYEVSTSKSITWSFYLDEDHSEQKYGMFIGADLMSGIGIGLKFSTTAINGTIVLRP